MRISDWSSDVCSSDLSSPAGISEDDDLVLRAARAIRQASGANLGADLRIQQRIPLGAGLGGGSSNAPTTLIALNRLRNLGLPTQDTAQLGLHLGPDVTVIVWALTAWADGSGRRLPPA